LNAKLWMVLILALILAAGILAPAVGAAAATTDEQTIRDMDAEWSRAAESKDAAKFASFYSETGSVMPFNAPIATGKAKVQEVWTQLMSKPGFSLHFAPTQIEVAKSKDMAYDVGTFELKLNDPQGAAMTIPGKYVVVWKKQKGGSWKVEADIFNTDK
jgi:ketosteroid isomerase-like protein